jgi:hypothetical protein
MQKNQDAEGTRTKDGIEPLIGSWFLILFIVIALAGDANAFFSA